MSLAKVAHRLATDDDFAVLVQDQPETALATSGLTLDAAEWAAVETVLQNCPQWKGLCSSSLATPNDPPPWWAPQFGLLTNLPRPSSAA
jgi:hypothetical protein